MLLKLKFGFLESKNGSVKDKKVYDFDVEVGTYTGEIKDGDMHGQGELTLNQDGKVFSGKFTTNRLFIGKVNEKNSVYEGKLAAYKPNGEGVYYWKDVIEYHGAFNDGKYHGKGKKIRKKYLHQGLYALTVEGNFENGEPYGKCLAVYANGTVYDGEFVNGKRQGFGICKYKDGKGKNYDGSDCIDGHDYQGEEGFTYEGEWYQNKRHGKGQLKNTNGVIVAEGKWENSVLIKGKLIVGINDNKSYYDSNALGFVPGPDFIFEGEIKRGNLNGTGKLTVASVSVYEGEWKEGIITGYGKMYFNMDSSNYPAKKGYTYEGLWQDNLFSGEGVLKNADGEVIAEGIWKNNNIENNEIKNVSRKETYENEDMLDGDLTDDISSGQGVLKNVEGEVIAEETCDNKEIKNDVLKETYDNGDVYEGERNEGKRHGFGKMTYADGDVYDGEWEDDVMSGSGTYTDANGDIYDGEWDDDCQHGNGKMTYKNDNFEYFGSWSYGQWHRLGQIRVLIENTDPSYDPLIHNCKKEQGFYYLGKLIKGTRQYFDDRNEEGIFIPDMLEIENDNTICLNTKINEYLEQNDFQSAIELCEKVIDIKFNETDYWQLLDDEHIANEYECIVFPYDLNANEFKNPEEDIDLKPELLLLIEEIKNKQLQNTIQSFDFSNQKSEETNNNADDFDDFA